MSPLAYYLLWLLLGLLAVAAVSAAFTRTVRRREQALMMARALSRHSVWVAAQRSNLGFELQREVAEAALREACAVQARCFPRLAPELRRLLLLDRQLEQFLVEQQRLRTSDPEAWLESDQDQRFVTLWEEYLRAAEGLMARLRRAAGERPAEPVPQRP